MTKKNLLTGLILLALVLVVGADLGLLRSEARQVAGLVLRDEGVDSASPRVGTDVRVWRSLSADSTVAAALAGRVLEVGAVVPSRHHLNLLNTRLRA